MCYGGTTGNTVQAKVGEQSWKHSSTAVLIEFLLKPTCHQLSPPTWNDKRKLFAVFFFFFPV
jgi:hypothetical protein